jgi:hypothetical protein
MRDNRFQLRPLLQRKRIEFGRSFNGQNNGCDLIKRHRGKRQEPAKAVTVEKVGLPRLAIEFLFRKEIVVGDDVSECVTDFAGANFTRISDVPTFTKERFENFIKPFRRRVKGGGFRSMVQHLCAAGFRDNSQFMEHWPP